MVASTSRRPVHRVPSRRERAGRRAGSPRRQISLSCPASIAAAWKDHSQASGLSLVDVLLDAVSTTHENLPSLVRARQDGEAAASQAVPDGLFWRVPGPVRTSEPFVTMPLRMLSANVDVLDRLVHETGADSRSQVSVVALDAYLRDVHARPDDAVVDG